MGHRVEITPAKRRLYCTEGERLSRLGAEAEAVRRWGASGRAWLGSGTKWSEPRRCCVGAAIGETPDAWQIFGMGQTFVEALADAATGGH